MNTNIGDSGDFLGFTFGGKHSSSMGITRTSDGSRYNENLLPTLTDKTVQVPGGDGTYYFGSYFTQKQFSISFATDKMTEEQFRSLRIWLGDKELKGLIFDEAPYKEYMVKVMGTPSLKFICFDNGSGERTYKGEGSVQFVGYFPFARCKKKYLSEYSDANYPNKSEWAGASRLKETQGTYDGTGNTINLYNPGDLEADFCAYYARTSLPTKIYIGNRILEFDFSGNTNVTDDCIRINSKNNLIEGCDANRNPTGTLYNKYITSGEFFKIPRDEPSTDSSAEVHQLISVGAECVKIDYDYLYY